MRIGPLATAAVATLLAAGCGTAERPSLAASAEVQPTAAPTPTATPSPTPTPAPTPTPGPPTPTPSPTPIPRVLSEQAYVPFGTTGEVTLNHPAATVELIGFHESGHDGAQQIDAELMATNSVTLESRDRDTGSRTAADVVVDPTAEIRSPVTGTVISAGTYVLYCDYSDDLVFIEPDARPGWQVKIFHIDGVQVAVGDRVEAGVTVLAPRATRLPFDSQVDEITAEPSWPHVHIEVVDPSVPDRPTGPGC